ncbi:MAG: hypothetical protein ACRD3E_03740 [Terriglobales bacterium]
MIPGGLLITEPPFVFVVIATNTDCTGTKFAVTDCAESMVTVHAPMPEQVAAFHPAKPEPLAALATNVTLDP